jgi:hypothetical protein
VAQNRSERQNQTAPSLPVLTEMLRLSTEPKEEDGKGDGKLPTFWKVFGSTVLSISAMVVVTAYQSLSSDAAEVRGEVTALNNEMRKEFGRLSEAQGELVKQDEFDTKMKCTWTEVNDLQEDKKELVALKEHCAALAKMQKESQEGRRQLAQELQSLREKRIQQEERRALTAEVSALRERLAGLEGKQSAQPMATPASAAPGGKVGRAKNAIETAVATVKEKFGRSEAFVTREGEERGPFGCRSYRGWLSATYGKPINGHRPYLLKLNPPVTGLSLLYVVPGPGVDLQEVVGTTVELRGPVTYRGELDSYVMEARQATSNGVTDSD